MALSFNIVSAEQADEVEVTTTPWQLSSGFAGFETSSEKLIAELFLVHQRQHSGIGIYATESITAAELLLKDDRQSLKDSYIRVYKNWKHLIRPRWLYAPPNLRLQGPVCTSLSSMQSKQIWVSVKIPDHAAPGTYEGTISVSANGRTFTLSTLIDVLPIVLLSPRQDLMIWYKGTIDWRNTQHYVSPDTLKLQLRDIYEHGFRSLSMQESEFGNAQQVIDIAEEIGFDRHILLHPPFPPSLTQLRFSKLTPVFYLSDEIDLHTNFTTGEEICESPRAINHKLNRNTAKEVNGRTMCSLYQEQFASRLFGESGIGAAPEVLSYCLIPNREYFFFRAQFPQLSEKAVYYYWPAHMEKPNLHRVLAGVYLWKSTADGIAPYCYQHLPAYPHSPYDDFDEWEPGLKIGTHTGKFRDHLATYPARGGSVPTIQWEGMREGITDLRYLTTIDALIREASASDDTSLKNLARDSSARMQNFLSRIDLRSVNIVSERDPEPYEEIDALQYHEFRQQLAWDILALQAEIRKAK